MPDDTKQPLLLEQVIEDLGKLKGAAEARAQAELVAIATKAHNAAASAEEAVHARMDALEQKLLSPRSHAWVAGIAALAGGALLAWALVALGAIERWLG